MLSKIYSSCTETTGLFSIICFHLLFSARLVHTFICSHVKEIIETFSSASIFVWFEKIRSFILQFALKTLHMLSLEYNLQTSIKPVFLVWKRNIQRFYQISVLQYLINLIMCRWLMWYDSFWVCDANFIDDRLDKLYRERWRFWSASLLVEQFTEPLDYRWVSSYIPLACHTINQWKDFSFPSVTCYRSSGIEKTCFDSHN